LKIWQIYGRVSEQRLKYDKSEAMTQDD